MPGKVLVNAFTWERKHTDFYCLLPSSWPLLNRLCVDGNARPPPFISEPPRAGAVNLLSQGRGLPVTKATGGVGSAGAEASPLPRARTAAAGRGDRRL